MSTTPEPVPFAALTVVETPPEPFRIRDQVGEVLHLVEETVVRAMKDLPTKQRRAITRTLRDALAEATELLVAEPLDNRREVADHDEPRRPNRNDEGTEKGGAA